MGYSLSWTAVRGKPPAVIRESLGLAQTKRTSENGVTSREPFAWCELEGGWVLVLASTSAADDRFLADTRRSDAFLASLSVDCEVVACFVEEHVMVSRAAAWTAGALRWEVKHDGQVGLDHLERAGAPPAGAEDDEAEARRHLANDPDPVDYLFAVPSGFANAVVPYRHDSGDHVYEALDRMSGVGPRRGRGPVSTSARPSFLSRLLGRKG